MDQLIYKYLKGELNLEEQHKLSKWLDEDVRNQKILSKLQIYWDEYHSDLSKEDLEVRLRILSKMREETHNSSNDRLSFLNNFIRVAAILVIGLSVAFFLPKDTKEEQLNPELSWIEKATQPGQKITTILPDGTRVKLNTNSKLVFPDNFASDVRKVVLQGEAFFDVTRDETRPFIIETGNMEVRVLGTSFLVSAYQDQVAESVAVKSGRVEVKGFDAREVIQLSKFEIAKYQGDDRVSKSPIQKPEFVFGWVDQKLLFDNHSIEEVLQRISKWYGVEIILGRGFSGEKKYTASYDNPTLREVMDVLAFVYDFKYELKGNDLIIK